MMIPSMVTRRLRLSQGVDCWFVLDDELLRYLYIRVPIVICNNLRDRTAEGDIENVEDTEDTVLNLVIVL